VGIVVLTGGNEAEVMVKRGVLFAVAVAGGDMSVVVVSPGIKLT